MPQLQLNSGPQDALLYDNTRSYFTNVGYVRTSNFQLELRDIDAQNSASLGSTMQFVIPKAADLLGPVDLMLEFDQASGGGTESCYAAWVESVGLAMIEKVTFSVGSHDIETVTGDQLNIVNELMKSDSQRLGRDTILKSGQGASVYDTTATAPQLIATHSRSRTIYTTGAATTETVDGAEVTTPGVTTYMEKKKLIVPLGLFFTKHPSQYFPLAAIAGCNDVRISVKLRSASELVQMGATDYAIVDSVLDSDALPTAGVVASPIFADGPVVSGSCKLRCHYVHVTGPEATTLMNKEHVRLLKLWQVNTKTFALTRGDDKQSIASMDLSFLHPVSELIITIRKASEMGSSTSTNIKPEATNQGAVTKNYFAYHGGGKDPNPDSFSNKFLKANGQIGAVQATVEDAYLTVDNIQLTLNGQERHPSLAAKGLDRNYLMNRLMPMLHSNSSTVFSSAADTKVMDGSEADFAAIGEMLDRKEIYVYPFSLNPEGSNPSGAVNFSKVSHAKLAIEGIVSAVNSTAIEYQVDVYGVHYNWLQIKDGRALTSFA